MDHSHSFPVASQNPRGVLFRFVFGQPEHAIGLLHSALPPETAALIDQASLQRVDRCFVDAALDHLHADVVFEARIGDRQGFVYMLLAADGDEGDTSLHVERYVGRLLDHWRTEHPAAQGLPPVVPYVLRIGDGAPSWGR